ncbi:exo-alpha-sialidase [Armatimonas sp.]|uniref:sialidase family protein n=1 Tax=Armatimonas sp. TaxID=1872638 RepID=UPI00286AA4C7|nr:exo-alpha-sialidase [Armatimonas sp.]
MTKTYSSELIFPLGKLHSHSSSIVEFPRGQLLVCWYMGSGERKADDVRIMGATKPLKGGVWSKPFVLADTPGFPDTNCVLTVNGDGRLWLFYGTQLDNNWESTLLKYKVGRKLGQWDDMGVVPLKPGDEEFPAEVRAKFPQVLAAYPELEKHRAELLAMADNKLKRRMGWMGRCKPLIEGKRMLLPLYSDGYNFSLIAITDDGGATWTCSKPLIGPGAVQPSLVRRKDGVIVAFCRNNGPAPQRMLVSESSDNGLSWTVATHHQLLNPGSSVDVLKLRDGRWLICYNDTESGRHQLALSYSEDEGKSWTKTMHLDEADIASKSYPSLMQASDGSVHVTYSFSSPNGETIRHVRLSPL